ncbi:MAG: hypothetical protein ACRD3P_17665 [Terriglobales bacterium]
MKKKRTAPASAPAPVRDEWDRDFAQDDWNKESTARAQEYFYTPAHELEAERKREQEIQHKARIAREEEEARLQAQTHVATPMVWLGELRDLADFLLKDGNLKARNKADVYRQMRQHFLDKNGQPLKLDSLRVNMIGKIQLDRGNKK